MRDDEQPASPARANRPRFPASADRPKSASGVKRADVTPPPAAPPKVEAARGAVLVATTTLSAAPARAPSEATGQPMLTPVRSRLSLPPRREAQAAERSRADDPIIQVTIGRVEVRAATAPEPRQKPRPANGATSLDDYLRLRSGQGKP